MKKEKKKGITLIRWANCCNNHCVMCSLHSDAKDNEIMTFDQAVEHIKRAADEYSHIEFTGGEPTVREGLADLIKIAKEFGYEFIGISTNGRKLSDKKYCDDLVSAGLNYATIALHGHDAETHEKMSGVPGSFNETVGGIKNLVESGRANPSIASVMNRLNYDNYHKIGELILDLGVTYWGISDLIPDGKAKEVYDKLGISPEEKIKSLQRTIPVFSKFRNLGIFNFSRCLFPKNFGGNKVTFFDAKAKAELWNMERIEGRYTEEDGVYKDTHKFYLNKCLECPHYKTCGGFWREEIELYGEEKITSLISGNL